MDMQGRFVSQRGATWVRNRFDCVHAVGAAQIGWRRSVASSSEVLPELRGMHRQLTECNHTRPVGFGAALLIPQVSCDCQTGMTALFLPARSIEGIGLRT